MQQKYVYLLIGLVIGWLVVPQVAGFVRRQAA